MTNSIGQFVSLLKKSEALKPDTLNALAQVGMHIALQRGLGLRV